MKCHGSSQRQEHGKNSPCALALCLLLALTGCATPGAYFADRGRDGVDIFTITVGRGAGAKVRVGPIQVGLLSVCDYTGIRNGGIPDTSNRKGTEALVMIPGTDFDSFVWRFEMSTVSEVSVQRHKVFVAGGDLWTPFLSLPVLTPGNNHVPYAFFTQIEAVIGIGGTLRLGFNPGELVDFLLGWTTIDIFNDDLERKKGSARE